MSRRSSDIPAYDAEEVSRRAHRFAVVVFALNEGERLQKQLTLMHALDAPVDIVVADGGSNDGSTDQQFLEKVGVRALLVRREPGGLSTQMRMAFDWALHQGYEGVIVIDGNGKDDVSAIPEFVTALEAGFDHVQGSRFVPGGRAINTPTSRLIGLKLIHAPLMSVAGRRRMTDTTNGFRAYSSRLLSDSDVAVFRGIFTYYELHYHLALESARRSTFRTTEVPVTRSYPAHGKTPTKISPIRGNARIMSTLLRAVSGRYRLRESER